MGAKAEGLGVLTKFLQHAARYGCILYGIDQWAIILAESGVLDGYAATTHWETIPAAQHRFPNVSFEEKNLVVDRNRVTSPGHTACLDLLVNLIAEHASNDLSIAVANELIHSRLRPEGDQQRLSYFSPKIGQNSYIDFALAIMRNSIEQPRKISAIAREVGVSTRQLELRFQSEFDLTPSSYYTRLRLSAARQYLVYSNMAILNVAFSCGFSSHGAFSRSFRNEFKMTPTEYRSRFNAKTDRSYVE